MSAKLRFAFLMVYLGICAATSSCDHDIANETGNIRSKNPTTESENFIRLSDLQAGAYEPGDVNLGPDVADALPDHYQETPAAIAEGKKLFSHFNCTGCHANGGGGSGPALMDDRWFYGSKPEQIFSTIIEGRPNGMPSWARTIPASQVWQLVAYVRSLGGLTTQKPAQPQPSPQPQAKPPEPPKNPAPPTPPAAKQ